MQNPGRYCPSHYHYGAKSISQQNTVPTDTLYVVGGLYGNPQALKTIIEMAQTETHQARIVFNGDFNWFNIDDTGFYQINHTILQQYDAIQGNVENELIDPDNHAGCGCAYPEDIDDATVMRSNEIHALLKQTAQNHPAIINQLTQLPLFLKYQIGKCQIGVVHGDSETLAGWGFDQNHLRNPNNNLWLAKQFAQAGVHIFASSHTCLPVLKLIQLADKPHCVINNGSAGMPNFQQTQYGLISHIATTPSPLPKLYGCKIQNLYIDALPVHFDIEKWIKQFQLNWSSGSAADISYFQRIRYGTNYKIEQSIIS